MKLLYTLISLALLSGCSTWQEMPLHEKTFHIMNVVDAGQTINIARRPDCFREVGFPTHQMLGSHPSETEVYVSMAAFSLAYHYGDKWFRNRIARHEPGTQANGLWSVTRAVVMGGILIGKGATIVNNADIGLSPWGSGCSEPGSF